MRIIIKAPNNEVTAELRELIERRAHYALSRFEGHIDRVVVTLENGPVSRCQVSVRGRNVWQVLVRDEDDWIATAFSRAMSRAGRTVARRVDRQLNRRLTRMQRPESAPGLALQEVLS